MLFLLSLYLFIMVNIDAFNRKRMQNNSVEKVKEIFELEDEEYTAVIKKHRHLINEAELNLSWSSFQSTKEILDLDKN